MSEQAAATISAAEEAAIKRTFDALVAEVGGADGCMPSARLFDLSAILNDPLSPADLDRATKKLGGSKISFEAFFEYWRNDDYDDAA